MAWCCQTSNGWRIQGIFSEDLEGNDHILTARHCTNTEWIFGFPINTANSWLFKCIQHIEVWIKWLIHCRCQMTISNTFYSMGNLSTCSISYEWTYYGLIDHRSTMVMAWCHQAARHHLNQSCWRVIVPLFSLDHNELKLWKALRFLKV